VKEGKRQREKEERKEERKKERDREGKGRRVSGGAVVRRSAGCSGVGSGYALTSRSEVKQSRYGYDRIAMSYPYNP
jgi:hypothetical protein